MTFEEMLAQVVEVLHTQGWPRLESSSVSYGKATAYLPIWDLLKAYCRIEDRDDLRAVRAKVTGHILMLDEAWCTAPGAQAPTT